MSGRELLEALAEQRGLSAEYARVGDHRSAWRSLDSVVERVLGGTVATPEVEALGRIADELRVISNRLGHAR